MANKISFDVPLFECGRIIVCFTRKSFAKQYRKYHDEDIDDDVLNGSSGLFKEFHNTDTGDNRYIIGVFNNQYGTLCHEAAHATFAILDAVGVPAEPGEANETFCYMLGYIVRQAGKIDAHE